VGHDRRQLDERLDAAKTLGDLEEAQARQNAARLREPPLHLERDDSAEAVHLRSRDIMAGVIVEPGIIDSPYTRAVLQEPRDLDRVFFMLPHAQRESLYPSKREKTVEGRGRRARGVLPELQSLVEGGFIQTDCASDDVRVPGQVFCRRVKDEIGAELKRPLENRRCEGVVDQTESAVAVGDFCRRPDVGDPQKRIGRRLDPDKPGAPSHGALDLSDLGSFDEGKCEPEVFQHCPEESVGTAVNVARGDHMIALFEQEHRSGRRAHTGGEGEAVFGRFQSGKRRLERGARRIVGPRIVVALVDARCALSESAGLIDRNSDRPGRRFGFLSGVNGARRKLHELRAALFSCHQGCPPM